MLPVAVTTKVQSKAPTEKKAFRDYSYVLCVFIFILFLQMIKLFKLHWISFLARKREKSF